MKEDRYKKIHLILLICWMFPEMAMEQESHSGLPGASEENKNYK